MRTMKCKGTMMDGPDKLYARCDTCRRIDYELYENDRCGAELPITKWNEGSLDSDAVRDGYSTWRG